jgi:hypothetical protein
MDSINSRQGPVIDWWETGNERTGAIKGGKFLE